MGKPSKPQIIFAVHDCAMSLINHVVEVTLGDIQMQEFADAVCTSSWCGSPQLPSRGLFHLHAWG